MIPAIYLLPPWELSQGRLKLVNQTLTFPRRAGQRTASNGKQRPIVAFCGAFLNNVRALKSHQQLI